MSLIKRLLGRGEDAPQAPAGNGGGQSELPADHKHYVVCRHCQRKVKRGVRHQCHPMKQRRIDPYYADDDLDDFFISYLVASTTDNWALGYLAGGHPLGAILGDAFADDGYEADITDAHVLEIPADEAFLDEEPAEAAAADEPVIDVDPEEEVDTRSAGPVDEPVDSSPDVDDTGGDSGDSY